MQAIYDEDVGLYNKLTGVLIVGKKVNKSIFSAWLMLKYSINIASFFKCV